MELDLKSRIRRLGIKQNYIAKTLSKPGFSVTPQELSNAIAKNTNYPKDYKIRNEVLNLLTKLEHERGLD